VRANCSQTVDKFTAAAEATWISHDTCHKIVSEDMNMSRVTQHSVPRVLTQGQLGDGMRISDDLIDNAQRRLY
jgi:hypothetical protein